MSTGDQDDMLSRLRGVLPIAWFPDESSSGVLDGLLSAAADIDAFIYSLLTYTRQQTRIKTATDGWLDLIAYDFFGLRIQRTIGQSDTSFLSTIITEIFRIRNTRAAYIKVLQDITGETPTIFEGWRDGAYLNKTLYLGISGVLGSRGYSYTVFINAFRGNDVTDAQIYAAVESVRTAGITAWVLISNVPGAYLDSMSSPFLDSQGNPYDDST